VNGSGFWTVSTAAVLAVASLGSTSDAAGRAFLWTVALLDLVLVVLFAPNDGGGQWGPRYLLFAYVPLALLAADILQSLPRRRVASVAVMVLVLAGSLWIQRAAYRQLRGAKAGYGAIVDLLEATTPPGGTIVTDVWWLDQLGAAALDTRTLLFAGEPETGRGILDRLDDVPVQGVTVVRSREVSPEVDSWSASTCYVEASRTEIPARSLVAIVLSRRCQAASR
jgi:hypothetical protein